MIQLHADSETVILEIEDELDQMADILRAGHEGAYQQTRDRMKSLLADLRDWRHRNNVYPDPDRHSLDRAPDRSGWGAKEPAPRRRFSLWK